LPHSRFFSSDSVVQAQALKSTGAHRIRDDIGQSAFPLGVGCVRSDDRFDLVDGVKQ